MNVYYDGTELLSKLDIDGEKPGIYIATSNRTGGKTTYFNRLLVNRFKRQNKKFLLLYRYKYEVAETVSQFFPDIKNLFFHNDVMTSCLKVNGAYAVLYYNKQICGYSCAINCANTIKKFSHVFNDVETVMFDEFMSETNDYCPNEIEKFRSIITSVSRGQGEQYRYVPVYLVGNPVTMLNPYYVSMGISSLLNENTKFLRGKGFVLEQGYNENAAKAQINSAFNKAFSNNESVNAYLYEARYLSDSLSFIETVKTKSRYIATLVHNHKNFAIRATDDFFYVDDKPDITYKVKLCRNVTDHNLDTRLISSFDPIVEYIRKAFMYGRFRFKNLECKNAIIHFLSF